MNNEVIKGRYFRVCTITKLGTEGAVDMPMSYGLGIEKLVSAVDACDEDYYYVVGFVKPGDSKPVYEDVDFRTFDNVLHEPREVIDEFVKMVELAKICLDIKELAND